MYKKIISYEDFDGNSRKEAFYFNLTKAEIAEMELSTAGGLAQMIQKIIDEQDHPKIVATFKDLILKAVGEKSPDGKRFVKTKEIRDAFEQTNAYSELFMELATNADAAAEFVNRIVPADIAGAVKEQKTLGE